MFHRDAARAAWSGDLIRRFRLQRPLVRLSAVAIAAALLAACGDDDGGSDSTASTQAAADVSQISKFIEPVDPKTSGKGSSVEVGVALALSGDGSFYGANQLKAVKLAVRHIEELGGPKFRIIEKDHEGGMPEAGSTAAKELAAADVPMAISSYSAAGGSMLPSIASNKMLTLDPGGGTSVWAKSQPFFWGTRADVPIDTYAGVVRYLKDKMPDVKRVSMVAWDLGEFNEVLEGETRKALTAGGIELASYEIVPAGATDYAAALQRIKSEDPDLLVSYVWGLDLGNFIKAAASAGVTTPHIGSDFSSEAAEAAGPALDGYMFAYDFFDADNPPNGWAKLFVEDHRAVYGVDPDFYSANFYESTFALWRIVQRTLADKGNIQSGADLQRALEKNPTFDSLYGGDADSAGTLKLDLESHSVAERPLGLFEYDIDSGEAKTLATFGLGGAEYEAK